MAGVKVMPSSEKYANVLKDMKRFEFVPGFIKEHLGEEAVAEYQSLCNSATQPIPEEASIEERFDIAYKNWLATSATAFAFVRERTSDEGLEQFLDADVDSFKRSVPRPVMAMMNVIRAILPQAAFNMMAKQNAYLMQWMLPGCETDIAKGRMTVKVARCPIADYP